MCFLGGGPTWRSLQWKRHRRYAPEFMAKSAEALVYKSLEGSVEDRKQATRLDENVKKAWEEHFLAVVKHETLKARRERGGVGHRFMAERERQSQSSQNVCMKNNAPAATKAEKDSHQTPVPRSGLYFCCLLCFGLKNSHIESPSIYRSGKQAVGSLFTLPPVSLAPSAKDKGAWTWIANGRKAFNAVHGTELDLWIKKVQHMLGVGR